MDAFRVQLVIEEDGTETPPILPPATVAGRLIGPGGSTYHLIRLDQPVRCHRADTQTEWVLAKLVVAPKFEGASIDGLLASQSAEQMPVRISNILLPLEEGKEHLDLDKVLYFAVGWLRAIRHEGLGRPGWR